MKIVGVIPARYQSARFPGKPLVDILGKPMIQHVYEKARCNTRLDRLLVATDDERILEAVQAFGGEALLTREDHPSGTDRIAEVCRLLQLADEDIVINIQGDEPLIQQEMISLLITALERFPDSPMATLVFRSNNMEEYTDSNTVKVTVDRKWKALYFSRSPIPYRRDSMEAAGFFLKHLGLYAFRNSFLQLFTTLPQGELEKTEKLEQLRALEYGFPIQVALSRTDTFGVDTPEDRARLLSWLADKS